MSQLNEYKKNAIAFLIFIAVSVLLAWITAFYQMERSMLVCVLFAIVVTASYPLKLGNVTRLNVYWLIVPILYMYGVTLMLVFYQVAILLFLYWSRSKEGNFLYYPIYALVFLVGPFLSYQTLSWAGMNFVVGSFLEMLVMNSVFYSMFLLFSSIVWFGLRRNFQVSVKPKELQLLELVNSIVFVLLATALTTFIQLYGEWAILGATLFYVMIAMVTRHYDATKQKAIALENIVDLQLHFSEHATKEQLVQDFLQHVKSVTGAQRVSLVDEADMYFIVHNNALEKTYVERYQLETLQKAFAKNGVYSIEKQAALKMGAYFKCAAQTESLLALPLSGAEQPMILVLESEKRFAFKEKLAQCQMLITAYLNAREHYAFIEKTIYKSERCVLTGLYNYRYLMERMDEMNAQIMQRQLTSVAAIMLDVDYFKQLNDTFGHENGNLILKEFATRLKHLVSEQTILARYGGEEFVMLVPNVSAQIAAEMAEHYREMIAQQLFSVQPTAQSSNAQQSVQVTVSIGVASMPEHTDQLSDLIRLADRALYVGAKQAGRNRVAVYDERMSN